MMFSSKGRGAMNALRLWKLRKEHFLVGVLVRNWQLRSQLHTDKQGGTRKLNWALSGRMRAHLRKVSEALP